MNTVFTSTQKGTPLTVGSLETFDASGAQLNGSTWDLTGGTVNVLLEDPTGTITTLSVSPPEDLQVNWTVVTPAGPWTRTWSLLDASGNKQVTKPYSFSVIASPS